MKYFVFRADLAYSDHNNKEVSLTDYLKLHDQPDKAPGFLEYFSADNDAIAKAMASIKNQHVYVLRDSSYKVVAEVGLNHNASSSLDGSVSHVLGDMRKIDDGEHKGLEYRLTSPVGGEEPSAIIFGHTSNSIDLMLPETIEGYRVSAIAPGAFEYARLESVLLPDGLETIGERAFADNILHQVSFPSSIKTIGDGAFTDNPDLRSVELPDNLFSAAANAFDHDVKFIPLYSANNVISLAR
jgi:hypothetical protein